MKQIPGPVLAVGHSYGGAVISNAVTGLGHVVGLVFIAAFAPDEGERLGEVTASSRDSVLGTAQVALQYPTPDGTRTDFAIDPAKLHDVFAADLPAQQAAVMAATQRPVSELAFTEPSGPPAWKSLPSWTVLASPDKAAGTDVVRSMAERAGATITEVEGSHVITDLPARRRRRRDQDRGGRRQSPGRRHGGLATDASAHPEVTVELACVCTAECLPVLVQPSEE